MEEEDKAVILFYCWLNRERDCETKVHDNKIQLFSFVYRLFNSIVFYYHLNMSDHASTGDTSGSTELKAGHAPASE